VVETRGKKQQRPVSRSAEKGNDRRALDEAIAEGPANPKSRMQRGVSQLLFNYLPERLVDWEDGLAIVRLGEVRLSVVWQDERKNALLEELADLFRDWTARGGTLDRQFPDPTRERSQFTIGLPETIGAGILHTAMVCQACSRLHFPRPRELAKSELECSGCGGQALRQFGQVFVHGCGELVPITEWLPGTKLAPDGVLQTVNRPLRCRECGQNDQLVIPLRSERAKDMSVSCERCNVVVFDRLTARCARCLSDLQAAGYVPRVDGDHSDEATDESGTIVTRILMRMTRYSASEAYYPHTLSMLRLDRPSVVSGTDAERDLLHQLIPSERRGATLDPGNVLISLAKDLAAAITSGNQQDKERLQRLIALEAASPGSTSPPASAMTVDLALPPELERAVYESLAFRETVSARSAVDVARAGGSAALLVVDESERLQNLLGVRELLLVDDLPVITAAYGYTRRDFEPTYEEGKAILPTRLRAFPSLGRWAAQRLGQPELAGTVPILAREGEHEGLFLSLPPDRVVRWIESNGVELPRLGDPPVVRLLAALEPIDRYYDDIWSRDIRRLVFGLVHSLSHVAMRAASRFSGVERTSISEYLFLPLLGAVVFDNSTSFRLGGMETLVRDQLLGFLRALADEAVACIYDPHCTDHRGACHGCIHSPEISCRMFNHGLSRSFLIGGHAPWTDVASEDKVRGYWQLEEVR